MGLAGNSTILYRTGRLRSSRPEDAVDDATGETCIRFRCDNKYCKFKAKAGKASCIFVCRCEICWDDKSRKQYLDTHTHQTKEDLKNLKRRVKFMPGRIICESCIGHDVGADILTNLWKLIKSALCWYTEEEEARISFLSKVRTTAPLRVCRRVLTNSRNARNRRSATS